MREIIFRAWDKNQNKMRLDILAIEITGGIHDNIYFREGKLLNQNDALLMQYTGLQDKNGKKIFEGDIHTVGEKIKAVVEWDKEKCSFISVEIGNKENKSSTLYGIFLGEIIGNIHENPELLTPNK